MADYIDRQTAIRAVMNLPDCPNGYSDTYDKACIVGMLEEVPSIDAVEVVRCKDCVNCEYDSIFNQYWCGGSEVISDGFCNYGEREDPLHGAMNPPEDDITDDKGVTK